MWKYLLAGAKSVAMPGRTYQLDADGLISEPEPVDDEHVAWFTRSKDWAWVEPPAPPAPPVDSDALVELHEAFTRVTESEQHATRVLELADRLDAELAPELAPEHQGLDGFEVNTTPDAPSGVSSPELAENVTSTDVKLDDEPKLPPSVRPGRRRKE